VIVRHAITAELSARIRRHIGDDICIRQHDYEDRSITAITTASGRELRANDQREVRALIKAYDDA
jgi:hypothetical protein